MKNIFKEPKLEPLLLWMVALIPVCVLCFLALANFHNFSALNGAKEEKGLAQEAARFSASMEGWPSLSWPEKEKLIYSAILLFRLQLNCAILKSPGYYVVQIDHLLKQNPSAKENSLFTLLKGVAITEYDFYNGVNADEQALKFLGPKMFEENQKARKTNEESVVPLGDGW